MGKDISFSAPIAAESLKKETSAGTEIVFRVPLVASQTLFRFILVANEDEEGPVEHQQRQSNCVWYALSRVADAIVVHPRHTRTSGGLLVGTPTAAGTRTRGDTNSGGNVNLLIKVK